MFDNSDAERTTRPGYRFFMAVGLLTYTTFCLTLFTPADDLVMLWPYFFMVFTSPAHGLSPGSMKAILLGDVVGLAYLLVLFAPLRKASWLNYVSPPLVVIAAVLIWPTALLLLQFLAWLVARELGWPLGI